MSGWGRVKGGGNWEGFIQTNRTVRKKFRDRKALNSAEELEEKAVASMSPAQGRGAHGMIKEWIVLSPAPSTASESSLKL